MYRNMLVPLDGSELSTIVVPYAKELAGRLDLDLHFLHVCDPGEAELMPRYQRYVERIADEARQLTVDAKCKTGVPTGDATVSVYADVVQGRPAEGILRYSEDKGMDLILLATHGRSGVSRWVLGSVADKVLRNSKVPIWLVKANVPEEIVHDEWPTRKYLIPLDGSRLAESVLPHVSALMAQRGCENSEVILIRVLEPLMITADYPEASMPLSWEEHLAKMKEVYHAESERYLKQVEDGMIEKGLKVRSEVLEGDNPAETILQYAAKTPPNLIIMSTHGHSGIVRWSYGSVTDKVLHGSSSPMFIVRPV